MERTKIFFQMEIQEFKIMNYSKLSSGYYDKTKGRDDTEDQADPESICMQARFLFQQNIFL